MYNSQKDWKVEIIEMEGEVNEDILVTKIEMKNNEKYIVIMCYMTVEGGEQANQENRDKYRYVERVMNQNANEKIIIIATAAITMIGRYFLLSMMILN